MYSARVRIARSSKQVTPFGENIDCETRRILGLALELTCIALRVGDCDDDVRHAIANKIIALAKSGERNPDVLCEQDDSQSGRGTQANTYSDQSGVAWAYEKVLAQEVRGAAPAVPIVFVTANDPIKLSLVESLNRPGGTMTGVYLLTSGLEAKRLGVLRDVVPSAKTIGVLIHTNYSTADAQLRDVREAAARLGLQLVVAGASTDRNFEGAFAMLGEQRVGALLVCASPFFNNRRNQLVVLAARYRLPAAYEWREFAVAGGQRTAGADRN